MFGLLLVYSSSTASAVIMTGNNCKYHFHDGATQTGIFKMLYDDRRDETAECDFVLLNKTAVILNCF